MKNVAGAWDVWQNANYFASDFRRARNIGLMFRTAHVGSMGGFIRAARTSTGPGLRVRPPPSLLRGLQAPPDSLSPFGGAANFWVTVPI